MIYLLDEFYIFWYKNIFYLFYGIEPVICSTFLTHEVTTHCFYNLIIIISTNLLPDTYLGGGGRYGSERSHIY